MGISLKKKERKGLGLVISAIFYDRKNVAPSLNSEIEAYALQISGISTKQGTNCPSERSN